MNRRANGRRIVCAALALLMAGACSDNNAKQQLDSQAAAIARRIEDSRHTLNEHGDPETDASALARVVGGDEADDPPVVEAEGDVFHGGAELVVQLSAQTTGFAASNVSLTKCYRFRVTEAWFHVDYTTTDCPGETPISLPPTTAPRPDLGEHVDPVTQSLNALNAAERRDTGAVRRAVEAVVDPAGAAVAVDVRHDRVIGVAISRGFDCVLARVAATVEVWRPASVYGPYGNPGETGCRPIDAIMRTQQHPPH